MFYMIGMGIWDENDLPLRGIEAIKKSGRVFAELYTSSWGGSLRRLEEMTGREIRLLEREGVEEGMEKALENDSDAALLVPGDPLTATTHIHIIDFCRRKGIPFRIVHSSSILTAVAETGLQLYKFGRVATVVSPREGYRPISFYDALKSNRRAGLHTLFLLDTGMSVREGVEVLKGIDARLGEKIIACSRLGSPEGRILYDTPGKISRGDLPAPAVIIVPGKLHFSEEECLERFKP